MDDPVAKKIGGRKKIWWVRKKSGGDHPYRAITTTIRRYYR